MRETNLQLKKKGALYDYVHFALYYVDVVYHLDGIHFGLHYVDVIFYLDAHVNHDGKNRRE